MRAIEAMSAALFAGLGLAGAAAAQEVPAAPGAYHEVQDESRVIESFGITADELEELDLFGPTGDRIGEVEEVLAGPDGEPVALAVETEELFGRGGESVVVGFDRVAIVDRLTTSLDEIELEALPEWDDD